MSKPLSARIKQSTAACAMSAALFVAAVPGAQAAGIPVIDAAAITQMVQQLLQLQQQYDQLVRHLDQLKSTHQNFTGYRGFGSTLSDLRQYQFITRTIQNDFNAIRTTGAAALSGDAANYYQTYGLGKRCARMKHEPTRLACERQAAMAAYRRATWQMSTQTSLSHMDNINELRRMIEVAQDAKGIAEVQARIANEQNALETEKVRLDAVEREFRAERELMELQNRERVSFAFAPRE